MNEKNAPNARCYGMESVNPSGYELQVRRFEKGGYCAAYSGRCLWIL